MSLGKAAPSFFSGGFSGKERSRATAEQADGPLPSIVVPRSKKLKGSGASRRRVLAVCRVPFSQQQQSPGSSPSLFLELADDESTSPVALVSLRPSHHPTTSDHSVSFFASRHRHSAVHDAAPTPPCIRLSTSRLWLLQFLLDPRLDTSQTAKAHSHRPPDHSTVSPSPPNLCISGSMGGTTDQDDSPESLTPPNLGIMGPQAQQQMRNTKRELLKTQMVMIPPSVAEPMDPMILRFGRLRLSGESSRSVVPPIDPMQQRFGGLKVTGESSQSVVPPIDPRIQRFGGLGFTGKSSESVIPPLLMDEPKEKRKMFATFSKGHPVSEWEHWGYFNRMFGECLATVWSPSLCRW
nr:uncharacterized protein LOC109160696 isoform X2 [Ipomoea batatas]